MRFVIIFSESVTLVESARMSAIFPRGVAEVIRFSLVVDLQLAEVVRFPLTVDLLPTTCSRSEGATM